MELLRPELPDDWLLFDLDTSIIRSLADMAAVEGPAILSEMLLARGRCKRHHGDPAIDQGGGVGGLAAASADHMQRFAIGGDQAFFGSCRGVDWRLWQDISPVVRVVYFHGKPRPWEVGW
ncbi:hypothetical protein NKH58_25835 [Mesorhizobium australicum]|uniref:hypothetical protein n=1 Tax=Mesorhizobium australicum TaxID=536018 RepID=UPI00333C07E8